MPLPDVFRWLPLSDRKGLPTPRVLFCDAPEFGGAFYCRTLSRAVDGLWLGLEFDRYEADHIVLSTHWGDTPGSVIAHEHRHLQQFYRGTSLPAIGVQQPFADDGTYEGWRKAIRRYYRSMPWEMDALRYSMRTHRDQTAEQHFEVML